MKITTAIGMEMAKIKVKSKKNKIKMPVLVFIAGHDRNL